MSEELDDELESQNQPTEEVEKTTDESQEETSEHEFTETEKKMFARAKKAEAELKKLKAEKPKETITNNSPSADPDELRLIARGLSDEEIDQAKIIAKGLGKPLTEAIKSDLFSIYQKDLKDKQRRADAKLGGSKGSSQVEEAKVKPGMSRDEHKEAWNKAMGR